MQKLISMYVLVAVVIAFGQNQSFSVEQPTESQLVISLSSKCVAGPHMQPNGPFAVMVFCEGALGNYIALYYAKPMLGPISSDYPGWSFSNRIWQDHWGYDVESFAWSPNGKFLYVATSNIYGDGGLFEIDLLNRTSKQMFPEKLPEGNYGYSTEIVELDKEKSVLMVRESVWTAPDGEVVTTIHHIKLK